MIKIELTAAEFLLLSKALNLVANNSNVIIDTMEESAHKAKAELKAAKSMKDAALGLAEELKLGHHAKSKRFDEETSNQFTKWESKIAELEEIGAMMKRVAPEIESLKMNLKAQARNLKAEYSDLDILDRESDN
jgi:hypothetical protein